MTTTSRGLAHHQWVTVYDWAEGLRRNHQGALREGDVWEPTTIRPEDALTRDALFSALGISSENAEEAEHLFWFVYSSDGSPEYPEDPDSEHDDIAEVVWD